MKLKHYSLPIGLALHKAFSDEARIRILHLIWRNKQMCTMDLESVLEFTQTKTSRHLASLRNAGITTVQRIDNWVYYSISDEIVDVVATFLRYMEKDPQLSQDQEHYRIMFSNRELAANKLEQRHYQALSMA